MSFPLSTLVFQDPRGHEYCCSLPRGIVDSLVPTPVWNENREWISLFRAHHLGCVQIRSARDEYEEGISGKHDSFCRSKWSGREAYNYSLGPSCFRLTSSICGRVGPELWPHCPGLTWRRKFGPRCVSSRLRYSYSSETGESERPKVWQP